INEPRLHPWKNRYNRYNRYIGVIPTILASQNRYIWLPKRLQVPLHDRRKTLSSGPNHHEVDQQGRLLRHKKRPGPTARRPSTPALELPDSRRAAARPTAPPGLNQSQVRDQRVMYRSLGVLLSPGRFMYGSPATRSRSSGVGSG